MQSLAHYATQVEEICNLIDNETGDLTALQARFEQAGAEMSDKVDNWIGCLRGLKARVEQLKSIRDEYIQAARAAEKVEERLKDYLVLIMKQHPNIPFQGKTGKLRLQKNSAPSMEVDFERVDKTTYNVLDASLLSLEPSLNKYARAITYYVLDAASLKADIEANKGPTWAKLDHGSHVRIGV